LKIGVISDTHNFLDPQISALFSGVEHILHGGDIGLPKVLWELERIAPVTAVIGNTDAPNFGYRLNERVELAGRKFLLQHIVNPHALDPHLEKQLHRERPDCVIFGHTHEPFSETIDGVFFFNPGYAGKSRFGMPRTLAILHCTPKEIRPEYFNL